MKSNQNGSPWQELRYIGRELSSMTEGKPRRWLVLLFQPSASVIISFRLDRFGYLMFGRSWVLLRVLAWPLFFLLRVVGCHHEICFKASIGGGLKIIHPTMGVVVHADAIIGENCFLNGGNSIGARKPMQRGELVLGDNVRLGINACVLGPLKIGDNVIVGAGAMVVSDLPNNSVAVGVPARLKAEHA